MTRAWVAGPLRTLDGVSQGQRRFPQNLPAQKSPPCPGPLTGLRSLPQGPLSLQLPPRQAPRMQQP